MVLEWSEERKGKEGVSYYDHVIAETPLGPIMLEWKSWKKYDAPCGQMPWGEFVIGSTVEESKEIVQCLWDEKIKESNKYCTKND